MTKKPDWKCEECGARFSSPDNLPAGKKRFCSEKCKNKAFYKKKRDTIQEARRKRYQSDADYRTTQIARSWENKKRRRRGEKPLSADKRSASND